MSMSLYFEVRNQNIVDLHTKQQRPLFCMFQSSFHELQPFKPRVIWLWHIQLLHVSTAYLYIYIHICIVCVCDQYIRIQVTNVSHTSSHNNFVGPIIYTNIHTHIFVHVYVYSLYIYIYTCNYLQLYNMLVHGLPKQNTLNWIIAYYNIYIHIIVKITTVFYLLVLEYCLLFYINH